MCLLPYIHCSRELLSSLPTVGPHAKDSSIRLRGSQVLWPDPSYPVLPYCLSQIPRGQGQATALEKEDGFPEHSTSSVKGAAGKQKEVI